jgi:hypothetical protein
MKKLTLLFIFLLSFSLSNAQNERAFLQSIIDEVNIDSLMFFVEELSGERSTLINGSPYTIVSRHKSQPGNNMAANYIEAKLLSFGLTVENQNFSSSGRNVYGIQTGTEFPNQKYIICAHYDAMPSGSLAPGADDNGSGTAAVIEAARILSNYSFPFTLIYALWDEEEQGLIGSDYYAEQAAAQGDSILGVVNLDMIAYEGNGVDIVDIHTRSVGSSYDLSDKMIELNTTYNIGLITDIKDPGSTYSDHASFWSSGYGAILLIEDGSDFHPFYHTVNDVISYFDDQFFHKCARLSIATVASFAMNLNISIIHTPFASIDYSTDITLEAFVSTGLTLGSGNLAPQLYYRTDNGLGFSEFNQIPGLLSTESGTYSFTIPAPPLGTVVQYYLAAQSEDSSVVATLPKGGSGFNPPGINPPPVLYQFYVAPIEVVFVDNAGNMNQWQSTGSWNTTSQKFVSAPFSFTDSPSGNYSSNTNAALTTSDFIDLNEAMGAELKFQTQWDIESNWDYGQIQLTTDGQNWTSLEGLYTEPGTGNFQPNGEPVYDGTQSSWVLESIDLFPFIGNQIKLRFLMRSDGFIEEDGWYVDDLELMTYAVVPVELLSFSAVQNENRVLLEWTTATELNNRGFEIQRSIDNSEWQPIGFVDGRGTSSNYSSYSFSDDNPPPGRISYRLIQSDYDGTFEIYGPVEVEIKAVSDFALEQNYPNPFNPSTKISFSLPVKSTVSLKIYDILGEEVAEIINEIREAGKYSELFDATGLASGVYVYKLHATDQLTGGMDFIQTRKMILMR